MFHLFHLVCKFPWQTAWPGAWLVCGCCLFLFGFALCWFPFSGEICFQSQLIPVVDRPCLALVRQCRKKNSSLCSLDSSRNFGLALLPPPPSIPRSRIPGQAGHLGPSLSISTLSPLTFRSVSVYLYPFPLYPLTEPTV